MHRLVHSFFQTNLSFKFKGLRNQTTTLLLCEDHNSLRIKATIVPSVSIYSVTYSLVSHSQKKAWPGAAGHLVSKQECGCDPRPTLLGCSAHRGYFPVSTPELPCSLYLWAWVRMHGQAEWMQGSNVTMIRPPLTMMLSLQLLGLATRKGRFELQLQTEVEASDNPVGCGWGKHWFKSGKTWFSLWIWSWLALWPLVMH